MNTLQFQAKWRGNTNKERAAAQEHFIDLCGTLGMPTPSEIDKTGSFYTFEKGAEKSSGGDGFADVWWDGKFAWEYKGHKANLDAAYQQLLKYRESLNNPPLLVVCDLDRFQIHTNFTGTAKQIHEFTLDEIDQPEPQRVLRALFTDPAALKPDTTVEKVTEEAAARFGALATGLAARIDDPHRIAHFLVQLLFGLFAEDAGLLPKGLLTHLLAFGAKQPDHFFPEVRKLFESMRDGGFYNLQTVPRFNGGLFATIDPLPLTAAELTGLAAAATLDWGSVEPAIFGTLFERSLDPSKRAQLGAHYTGRQDIERVVDPVVMTPLRRRWHEVRTQAADLKTAWDTAPPKQRDARRTAFANLLFGFQEELAAVRVLDPACGSGNFLYVALSRLKDLEKEVIAYGTANGLPAMLPRVGPAQLAGLEINEYAQELAQVVVWIGYLQWMTRNGYAQSIREPVLEPLETIRLQDALLDLSDSTHPKEATWPTADFIIGNPPFLGGKRIRSELGDDYTSHLHRQFEGRLPPFSDLCCYFFEKSRELVEAGHVTRAGLLATNSIRGGANRVALDRIKQSGNIFMAWDDEPWVLDGAAVRISIVGFDNGSEKTRTLDGHVTSEITSALTGGVDLGNARRLTENAGIGFIGDQPTGSFDVPEDTAMAWLSLPLNPNGRPNSDVVRPYWSGSDIVGRWPHRWIVDFGLDATEQAASLYEAPFEYVSRVVRPQRATNKEIAARERWWLHWRPRPDMRRAVADACIERFLCTPHVSKHRIFAWLPVSTLPNNLLIVFARQDDYFFGVLHSRAHEVWSLRMGTWLGVGNDPRYTPTTCFETFPLPWPPGHEAFRDPHFHAIADAARALNERRVAWLNPPDASKAELNKRTLTNLYNTRPTWLAHLHTTLDRAVWSAYAWPDDPATTTDEQILERLLALNLVRRAHSHERP